MLSVAPSLARAADPAAVVRFSQRSEFQHIFVVDEGDLRYLRFGASEGDDQSVISLADANAVPMEYIQTASLGLVLCGACQRVLMIGLGGGTFTQLTRRLYPLTWIDAVEIDPLVIEVAERFFNVRPEARFHIHLADGAAFLPAASRPYDLVMLDAYTASDVPPTLITRGFFHEVADKLTPDGVVVVNLSVDDDIEELVSERFSEVFATAVCVRTLDDSNLLLFGRRAPLPPQLSSLAATLASDRQLDFDLAAVANRVRRTCP